MLLYDEVEAEKPQNTHTHTHTHILPHEVPNFGLTNVHTLTFPSLPFWLVALVSDLFTPETKKILFVLAEVTITLETERQLVGDSSVSEHPVCVGGESFLLSLTPHSHLSRSLAD